MVTRVLIMAGGTGGHIFPALAVAEQLRAQGAEVLWMGVRGGLETRLVPRAGFALEAVRIAGLRGKGALGWILLPARMAVAIAQSLAIIARFRPAAVLGMGGFVTGPGGLGAWLMRKPLLVHEQNAVAGLTNRWLAKLASKVMVAFPQALPRATLTGNPVRAAIAALPLPDERWLGRSGRLRVLVLGGSQGARALNEVLPSVLGAIDAAARPEVWHQTGKDRDAAVRENYATQNVQARVEPFIDDMAAAYAWADVAVCRAGALTIAELTAAGLGAALVPYPHAVDDHQTRNAEYVVSAGAAVLLAEGPALRQGLADLFARFCASDGRSRSLAMARAARTLAQPDAAQAVTRLCMEVAHG
ncbi:MAG: undecaprenyldiphospho-muramoylpentapeptide beta-N-acetylglucosaminyltransferase [Chromatiales bacterium]|jgi:UDP-N-acetylglucosamine--N-acetylmuramyl-(pentapeptide) pyrophosphoryl-undecaprenol N-acetylglucosamine transferase|nr:undecaprenyldiphospho-muramoylpentapeptide beta-N-acetylglucosaminyltransferase [Chromatiales bacterium]